MLKIIKLLLKIRIDAWIAEWNIRYIKFQPSFWNCEKSLKVSVQSRNVLRVKTTLFYLASFLICNSAALAVEM